MGKTPSWHQRETLTGAAPERQVGGLPPDPPATYSLAWRVDAQVPGPQRFMTQVLAQGIHVSADLPGRFVLTLGDYAPSRPVFMAPHGPACLLPRGLIADMRLCSLLQTYPGLAQACAAAHGQRSDRATVHVLRRDAYLRTMWLDPVHELGHAA